MANINQMKEGSKVLLEQPTRSVVPPIIFDGAGNILSFYFDGNPYMVRSENMNYLLIKDLVKEAEELGNAGEKEDSDTKFQDAINLIDHKKAMSSIAHGRVQVVGKDIYYSGIRIDNRLSQLMVKFAQQKQKFEPLSAFLENISKNPSERSRDQLFNFIEKHLFSITPEGNFLAYKIVRDNYFDIHSGKFDNSVGKTPTVDRDQVDDNPDKTCSYGLHVCGKGYIGHFGRDDSRLMLVEVNPKDVVSVPRDYGYAKMRVCSYRVLQELNDVYENDELGIVINTTPAKQNRGKNGQFEKADIYKPLRGANGQFIADKNNLNKCLRW